MKFCKDCKWYWFVLSVSWCGSTEGCLNPKNGKSHIEPVHGGTVTTGVLSLVELRKLVTACGPTAKWFEEKEKPIPKCDECKWCKDIGDGFPSLCKKSPCVPYTYCARNNETDCGKYGKWWEKKDLYPFEDAEHKDRFIKAIAEDIHESRNDLLQLVKNPFWNPKKQSWLCRLICGRKK